MRVRLDRALASALTRRLRHCRDLAPRCPARSLRWSVLVGTSAVGAAIVLALGVPSVTAGGVLRCAPGKLRLRLTSQGTSSQAVVFLSILNRSNSHCTVSGAVEFEVTQAGRRARIRANPIAAREQATLAPRSKQSELSEAHFWWANWCGSRRGLAVVARYKGVTVRSGFNYLPVCLWPKRPSSLYLGS